MKYTCLPVEGVKILIFMVFIGTIFFLTGCGTLTTLESCEKKIGEEKSECIAMVQARQENNRERFYDRR